MRVPSVSERPGALVAAGGVAGGLAAVAGWARWVEPRRLRLPELELTLPHWPSRLDGLRVAVIADLHAGGPHVGADRVSAVVDAVRAARPDLVALVGDYVDADVAGGRRLAPDAVVRRLVHLRAPFGVHVVLGNHDWSQEGVGMRLALEHAGLRVLENAAVRVAAPGSPLWVAGTGDLGRREARVGDALAAVPSGEPVLLLTHEPDVFPQVPARVALTLAGHLHGAQVDLPGLRRRVLPSRHGTRFKDGHVVEQGRHLFVSRGVGETGRAVRLLAPPEVPILRLIGDRAG